MPTEPHRRQSKRRRANDTADQVVADQVKFLRERRGMSQQSLADMLGWTQSAVARLEFGRRSISVGDLVALCWALDVAPIYMLAGSFQPGDVPIHKTLRVPPGHMKKWITGSEPLPGSNYRAYFENIPDDEWIARYATNVGGEPGVLRSAESKVAELAAMYQQAEELLQSGAEVRPGREGVLDEFSPQRRAELAEERAVRRRQLAASKKARSPQPRSKRGDDSG